MITTISVNGTDGVTLARSSGIRLVQENTQALVLHNQQPVTRHGEPGANAPESISGGPAGTLAVLLSESQLSQGAIDVQVVDSTQSHRLPAHIEIPIGRDLRLTAIGGIGETGQDGENGQDGLDGVDGTPASKGSDATNGTNGGDGGAAGRGSSGADGGPGGDIHVIMHESSTHLLMNVSWDLRGGIGGRAGRHGSPGSGGTGGKGGMGWQWEEIVGYKYFCTPSCIRRDVNVPSSSLARVGSRMNASTTAIMAPMRAHAVSGTNLERFISQAAIAYSAARTPRTDPGACKCGGGSGNCAGCDMRPIRSTFRRAPGLDGRNGESGATVTEPLLKGSKGQEGSMTIAVQQADGTTQRYTSPWSLTLCDFEIEDENTDGIFEPGEYIYIRRVTVRNDGGMPSPACQIPVSLADHSEHFEEVAAEDGGRAFLPNNIPAMGEASMEGSIKVRIVPDTILPAPGSRYSKKGWLEIRADMPWLEKRMPSFDLRKEVEIGYPCGFGEFEHLSTVAQSAISKIHFKVDNLGNQPIAGYGSSTLLATRQMEVRINIPPAMARLFSTTEEGAAVVDQVVPLIRPKDTVSMQQQFRVLNNAEDHKHFFITFDLYLEAAQQSQTDIMEMAFVERRVLRLQVSSTYVRTPNARFLLVTNPKTTERQSRAVQEFIQTSLHMEVDICNVHENGGLLCSSDPDSKSWMEEPQPILQAYHDKTVVFLDDAFKFFGSGEKTASQLCNPGWLQQLNLNNSSGLFIGTPKKSGFKTRISHSMFSNAMWQGDIMEHIESARIFASSEHFLQSVVEERQLHKFSIGLSAIILKEKKWYHGSRPRHEKEAQRLARYLRDHLPNERFIVSHNGSEHLLVITGLHQHHVVRSTECKITLRPANSTDPTPTRLDRYIKYMVIAAIPFLQRINILWCETEHTESIILAIQLSVLQDLSDQIHGLHTSKYRKLLRVPKDDMKSVIAIAKTHVPLVIDLLSHANARSIKTPPIAIIHVLQWLLALLSSLKRHKHLEEIVVSLLRNAPRTAHLLNTAEFIAGITTNDPETLVDQISELTATPAYVLEKGQTSSRQIVTRTEYWAPSRWDQMVSDIKEDEARLERDMDAAKRELGRMLVGERGREDSAMELSA